MKYKYNGEWVDLSIKALDSMPIGSIIQFAGSDIPNGWMICDGRTLRVGLGSNQTYTGEYADLYRVIGTTYGYVSYPIPLVGAIDFKIPDLRGKVPVGLDGNDADFEELGNTGGSKELQKHKHSFTYNLYHMQDATDSGNGAYVNVAPGQTVNTRDTSETGTGNSGNLQPYLVVNYIIKVKNTTPTMASVVNDTNSSTTDAYSCDYENKHYGGVVLYNNDSGTSSNITDLSDNVENYSYIEIYFKTNDSGSVASQKIISSYSGTKVASLFYNSYVSGSYYQNIATTEISNKAITFTSNMQFLNFRSPSTGSYIAIIKVIGYK